MGHGTIIAIEDDEGVSKMLRMYFMALGYDLKIVHAGQPGIAAVAHTQPDLVLLDVMLPDMDGYSVYRELQSSARTSRIPVIFLTQKDSKRDKIEGLKLGAVDYITKPFDIVELRLRVERIIERGRQQNLVNPRTGLPGRRLLEEQVRTRLTESGWALLNCQVVGFKAFADHYGFVAGNDVLRFAASIIKHALGPDSTDDFIGHTDEDEFVIILNQAERARSVSAHISAEFNQGIDMYYSFEDRDRGHMLVLDRRRNLRPVPLMTMSITVTTPQPGEDGIKNIGEA